jgi:hypothetical protein
MYSKCMVSPFIRTPMAIIASKGPEEVLDSFMDVRSLVEPPRRSPAPREEEVVDWIWEAEKSLEGGWLDLPVLDRFCVVFAAGMEWT